MGTMFIQILFKLPIGKSVKEYVTVTVVLRVEYMVCMTLNLLTGFNDYSKMAVPSNSRNLFTIHKVKV
jgi:D-serine dehydratase